MEPCESREETRVDSNLRRRIPKADKPLNGFPIFHVYSWVNTVGRRCELTVPK
jgi:hypothetical protein